MSSSVGDLARVRRQGRAAEFAEIRRVLGSGEWAGRGHRSPAYWLAGETGEAVGQCRLAVRVAERLAHMPLTAAAFERGELAESAVRLLADAWAAEIADVFVRDEALLVGWVMRLAHHDAKVVIERWVAYADPDRHRRDHRHRFDARRLHLSELLDGMHGLDGLLDGEGAAYLREALRLMEVRGEGDTRTAAQRRADALVQMAKFILDYNDHPNGVRRSRLGVIINIDYHDLTARHPHTTHTHTDNPDDTDRHTDDDDHGGEHDNPDDTDRHTDDDGDTDDDGGHGGGVCGGGEGIGYLNGTPVPAETIRRMCCDANIHRLVTTGASTPLDYGRATRVVSDSLFRFLTVRDGGCRFPGCDAPPELCDAHHADHWGHHGETEPDNLPLLCWYHHHFVHDQHWRTKPLGAGHFDLITPTGERIPMRTPQIILRHIKFADLTNRAA